MARGFAGRDESRLRSFRSFLSPRFDVRLRVVATGEEITYPASETRYSWLSPRVSRDGSLLAWVEDNPGKQMAYVAEPDGPAGGTRVCTGCRVVGFFANGDPLVLYGQRTLARQARSSGAQAPVLSMDSVGSVMDGALSPDERWIALQIQRPDESTVLELSPFRRSPAPESDWRALSSPGEYAACPRWSADGSLLYFVSDRDGYICIWGQRLYGAEPAGVPFAVMHEHRARYRIDFPGGMARFDVFGVAKGLLVWAREEITANLWKTKVDSN